MRRNGFTLLELVVVIFIISIVSVLISNVLKAAKQQSKAVSCSSNVKQLALVMILYDQDNASFPPGFDDSLLGIAPPPDGYPGTPVYDMQGFWWFNFLYDTVGTYTSMKGVLWCPSRNINEIGLKGNVLCGNYGVNRSIFKNVQGVEENDFFGTPLGSNQIPHQTQTMLITDSGYSLISWRVAIENFDQIFENVNRENVFYLPGLSINTTREILPAFQTDAMKGRHPKRKVNTGYADGHVSFDKAERFLVEENDFGYSNISPLWIPK